MTNTSNVESGYAPAAGSVAASAIHTGTAGLATRDASIDRGDVMMPIYTARPARGAE